MWVRNAMDGLRVATSAASAALVLARPIRAGQGGADQIGRAGIRARAAHCHASAAEPPGGAGAVFASGDGRGALDGCLVGSPGIGRLGSIWSSARRPRRSCASGASEAFRPVCSTACGRFSSARNGLPVRRLAAIRLAAIRRAAIRRAAIRRAAIRRAAIRRVDRVTALELSQTSLRRGLRVEYAFARHRCGASEAALDRARVSDRACSGSRPGAPRRHSARRPRAAADRTASAESTASRGSLRQRLRIRGECRVRQGCAGERRCRPGAWPPRRSEEHAGSGRLLVRQRLLGSLDRSPGARRDRG